MRSRLNALFVRKPFVRPRQTREGNLEPDLRKLGCECGRWLEVSENCFLLSRNYECGATI
jgi:hypothetical protein